MNSSEITTLIYSRCHGVDLWEKTLGLWSSTEPRGQFGSRRSQRPEKFIQKHCCPKSSNNFQTHSHFYLWRINHTVTMVSWGEVTCTNTSTCNTRLVSWGMIGCDRPLLDVMMYNKSNEPLSLYGAAWKHVKFSVVSIFRWNHSWMFSDWSSWTQCR